MGQKELWNSLSAGYSEKRGYGKGLMRGEKKMLSGIFREHGIIKVLDIGCGAGRHVRSFKSMGMDAMGADFSIEMLRAARKLGNESYFLADAEELPFREGSFECVTCLGNTMGSVDAMKTIKEMLRVSSSICIIDFRMERGKNGIVERRFDDKKYNIRVWNESEVSKMLTELGIAFSIKIGQKLERGYFFYAVIIK